MSLPAPASAAAPVTARSSGGARRWLKMWRARWIYLTSGSRTRMRGIQNLVTTRDALLYRCRIEIQGNNNRVEIGSGTRAWDVHLNLIGDGLICRIGANCRLHGAHYTLEDRGSCLEIGDGNTLWSPMCVVQEGGAIRIGSDCLVAYGADLRNSDAHSILDGATRQRINPAEDIRIEDHVWIGAQSQILKGVTLASRAVVAARSVVTKSVGPGQLVAGVPARVLRENIDWDARRL